MNPGWQVETRRRSETPTNERSVRISSNSHRTPEENEGKQEDRSPVRNGRTPSSPSRAGQTARREKASSRNHKTSPLARRFALNWRERAIEKEGLSGSYVRTKSDEACRDRIQVKNLG